MAIRKVTLAFDLLEGKFSVEVDSDEETIVVDNTTVDTTVDEETTEDNGSPEAGQNPPFGFHCAQA